MIKFARRYQGHGLDIGDLVQEAMLGLIRAAEKFDWRRGYKFSTYAVLWIKQSIQRGLDNTGRPVRIPAHIAQRERTVNRVTSELATKLDREPTDEEVAEETKLPLDEVMAIRDLTRVTTSLDQTVGEDDTTLGELHAESTGRPRGGGARAPAGGHRGGALAKLPEKERRIISARFGTGGREPAACATPPARSASRRSRPASSRPAPCAASPATSRSPAGAPPRKRLNTRILTRPGRQSAPRALYWARPV